MNTTLNSETTEVALGFGTLTLDPENRSSRYIGLSGGSAYLNADLWRMSVSRRGSWENLQASKLRFAPFEGSYNPSRLLVI